MRSTLRIGEDGNGAEAAPAPCRVACSDGKEIHSELTGHATSDVGDANGKIDGSGFSLKTLNEAIQKVSYEQ